MCLMEIDIEKVVIIIVLVGAGFAAGKLQAAYRKLVDENAELKEKSQRRWTHSELEQLENALFALGRYKFEKQQIDTMLENGIAWIAKMKNGGPDNGNGHKDKE